tara:strand:+ start:230 stop:535 length:306 start_codon:yes stop_codon:yes gene_type:complete
METIIELIKPNTFQENDFNPDCEGWQTVTWNIGIGSLYTIKATVNNVINMVDVGTNSMGEQLSVDAGKILIEDIISVHDYFGDEFEVSKEDVKLILNFLEI